MPALPTSRRPPSQSSAGIDKAKEIIDDDGPEKSRPPSLNNAKRPMWKRVLVGDANQGNETKRAMQSRHLTMIGARLSLRSTFTSPLVLIGYPLCVTCIPNI